MVLEFLIIGAQKGGTTALDHFLRSHSAVEMARKKEVHFFDDESTFSASCVDYSDYHKHFAFSSKALVRGEATPIYLYWEKAAQRIWEYNSEIKLVAVLRNPIERAYSHWNMERDRGAESLPFMQAIKAESERCREALPLQHRVYSYVDRGFYSEQLRRFFRFFPKEQMLILKFEDLRQKPCQTLNSVARFLGIPDFPAIRPQDVHSRPYVSSMSVAERDYLRSIFYYEIKQLEQMLGWNCEGWLK